MRLLPTFFLSLALASAAVSRVQVATPVTANSTTASISYGSNVTVGNTLIVPVANFASGTNAVASGLGNVCVSLGTVSWDFNQWVNNIFVCPVTVGGAETLTLTSTSSGSLVMFAIEYSGLSNSSILDGGGTKNGPDNGASGIITSSSFTTTVANDLLIAFGGQPTASATMTNGAGYIGYGTPGQTAINGIVRMAIEEQILTEASGVSHNAVFTFSSAQGQAGIVFLALKPAGAAAPIQRHRITNQ